MHIVASHGRRGRPRSQLGAACRSQPGLRRHSLRRCSTVFSFQRLSALRIEALRSSGAAQCTRRYYFHIGPVLLELLLLVDVDDLFVLPVLADASDVLERLVFGTLLELMLLSDFVANDDSLLSGMRGAGAAKSSSRLLIYALSARATGSPSLTKLRKRLFRKRLSLGFVRGSKKPVVTQT